MCESPCCWWCKVLRGSDNAGIKRGRKAIRFRPGAHLAQELVSLLSWRLMALAVAWPGAEPYCVLAGVAGLFTSSYMKIWSEINILPSWSVIRLFSTLLQGCRPIGVRLFLASTAGVLPRSFVNKGISVEYWILFAASELATPRWEGRCLCAVFWNRWCGKMWAHQYFELFVRPLGAQSQRDSGQRARRS